MKRQISPPASMTEIDSGVRELFTSALKSVLERKTLPVNISAIHDIMRSTDRQFHVRSHKFESFSQMCKWFEKDGLLELGTQRDSVMLKSSKLSKDIKRRAVSRSPVPRRTLRSRSPPLRRRSRSRSPPRRGGSPSRLDRRGRRSRSPPQANDRWQMDTASADDRWPLSGAE